MVNLLEITVFYLVLRILPVMHLFLSNISITNNTFNDYLFKIQQSSYIMEINLLLKMPLIQQTFIGKILKYRKNKEKEKLFQAI